MALVGNRIYISLNGTKIAAQKSCKLSNGCDTIETASATSGTWKTFISGRASWSMSCSWLVLSASAAKTNALRVRSTYTITFTDGSTTMTGTAICEKCDIESTVGSLVKGAFTFRGTGALS